MRQLVFRLEDWHAGDYQIIEGELGKISGVTTPGLDEKDGKVYIPYLPEFVSRDVLEKKMKELGFRWTAVEDERSKGYEFGMSAWGYIVIILIVIAAVVLFRR